MDADLGGGSRAYRRRRSAHVLSWLSGRPGHPGGDVERLPGHPADRRGRPARRATPAPPADRHRPDYRWPGFARPGIAHSGRLTCTMRALYIRFAKLVFNLLLRSPASVRI